MSAVRKAEPDTLVASARAYLNACNRLMIIFRKLKMPVYELIIIDKAIDEKGLPFGSPFRT